MLRFEGSKHGVVFTESCNDIILENVDAITKEETILARGGEDSYFGRGTNLYTSIFCRIRAKTDGAPAEGLYASAVPLRNIVIRDVTDLAQAAGVSVRIGDVALDGGRPNGLLEKKAGKYGFGSVQDNAMLRFTKVSDLKIEHFRVKQSRWNAMYLEGCTNLDVGNIDFATYTVTTDEGSMRLCFGCADGRIHEITGVVSGDLISLAAKGCDPAGEEIRNVEIGEITANLRRYSLISLSNHDGHQIHNVSIDAVMDVSLRSRK